MRRNGTVKLVLVDVDGTLIDTNDAHAHAWVEALAASGRQIEFEAVRPLIGMGGDQLLPRVAGVNKESDEGKALSEAWSRIFRDRYLPSVQPFPGAADLLQHIHAQGIKLVAASSGEKEMVDTLLDKVGVRELLRERTSSEDAPRSKPAPDIIAAALKKGGFGAAETILLGDSPYDIEAAEPLGVDVVAFRCGGFSEEALRGALALYADPADLLTHWQESPLGQGM